MSILRATQEMSAHVPVDRKVEKEDTEAAKTLIRVYHEEFSSLARTSAPDVVDGTGRRCDGYFGDVWRTRYGCRWYRGTGLWWAKAKGCWENG